MEERPQISLRVTVAAGGKGDPLELANPVMAASGTFGTGAELQRMVEVQRLGAILSPGVTRVARRPTGAHRLVETPAGLLSIGRRPTLSYRSLLRDCIPFWREWSTPVLVNVPADDAEECLETVAGLIEVEGVAGLEIDLQQLVSSQGVSAGRADAIRRLVERVRAAWPGPLLTKLPIGHAGTTLLASAAQDGGADAVSLGAHATAAAVVNRDRYPNHTIVGGVLAGPAVKPVALRTAYTVAAMLRIPVIGAGGIRTGEDAVDFLLCGASAVQVGTATYADPRAPLDVLDGLAAFLHAVGESDVRNMIGAGRGPE